MSLQQALKARLDTAFALTGDLFATLENADLRRDLPGLPSNRLAGQVWCIVGARESYTRALQSGSWQGFTCSLDEPGRKEPVMQALSASRAALEAIDFDALGAAGFSTALELLEHEVQHHGQLIRYIYANRLTFPATWNARYTV